MCGDLIRLRNRSKLVERSLFAIIDLAKSILFYFIWRVGGGLKKFKFKKKIFLFYFNTINFIMLLLLHKTLKRQSEDSGLRPDTSSLVSYYRWLEIHSSKLFAFY